VSPMGDGLAPLVLVIEDEPQMLRFLRPALEGHGYRMIEATSGREGLTEAATRSPDVVLLDLGLPDLDGFSVPELLARLRVALRHAARPDGDGSPRFTVGDLSIDLEKRRVTRGGEVVHLTPIEYRLLTELARHPGKVLTHSHLLKQVWGPASAQQSHYLRVYMAQLRRKLEEDPARPRILLTELGVGYRMQEP